MFNRLKTKSKNDTCDVTVKNIPDAINMLRVIACLCVLVLHAMIYTQKSGFDIYSFSENYPWVYLLKTPAWAGVWIFFFISAYLAGRGFFTGSYEYTVKGFLKYYFKKVIRIVIPVYAFAFFVAFFVYPHFIFNNPSFIFKFLFFNYNGNPGVDGIGALWYISTVMPVYLLAPFICLILDKTVGSLCRRYSNIGKITVAVAIIAIVVLGYMRRMQLFESGVAWYENVYTSTLANFDFFICGFLLNFITLKDSPQKKLPILVRSFIKIFACAFLAVVIMRSSLLYFEGEWFALESLYVYQYQMPTFFLIACCLYLFAFDYEKDHRQAPLTLMNCIKNPARILDFISNISFEIYMFHSVVYERMCLNWKNIDSIGEHVSFMLVGFLLSIIFGYIFHKIFAPKKKRSKT